MNMADTIRNNAHGCAFAADSLEEADVQRAAMEWLGAGFSPAECDRWLNAGCFDADSALALVEAGIEPAQANRPCPVLPGYSWAYAFANSDVSIDDLVAACKAD